MRVGDRLVLTARSGGAGDTVIVAAVTRAPPDPADVARGEYHVRLHLDQLQRLAWLWLVPLALLQLMLTGAGVVMGW